MDSEQITKLLAEVRRGKISVSRAVARLRYLPFEDLGFAKVDHHRVLRQGFPEVIMGQALRRRRANVLVTRLSAEKMALVKKLVSGLKYHSAARAATCITTPIKITGKGVVLVVCAGTSDIPVAEEAALTAAMMGNHVEKLFD